MLFLSYNLIASEISIELIKRNNTNFQIDLHTIKQLHVRL